MVYSNDNFISRLKNRDETAIEFVIDIYLPIVNSAEEDGTEHEIE